MQLKLILSFPLVQDGSGHKVGKSCIKSTVPIRWIKTFFFSFLVRIEPTISRISNLYSILKRVGCQYIITIETYQIGCVVQTKFLIKIKYILSYSFV